ncbi:hypothetical protein EC973_008548 [Apophysomyces ossiformis]|uniref:Uncharacterized protein n=1 Tax=Apophysomyces ossiformis TaxID=679940 RepID=A0A8H7BSF9_9FUNG|nr:hypothetical protein EC973_008548 [Apophysomyces ossiformis]
MGMEMRAMSSWNLLSTELSDSISLVKESSTKLASSLPDTETIRVKLGNCAKSAWENCDIDKPAVALLDKVKQDPKSGAYVVGGAALGVVALPCAAIAGLSAIGFTSGGVTAGSLAAGWMSTFGGVIPAGSLFASLQSAGALGAASGVAQIAAYAGGVTGGVAGVITRWGFADKTQNLHNDDNGENNEIRDCNSDSEAGEDEEDEEHWEAEKKL